MQLFVRDKHFYQNVIKISVPIVLQSVITIGVNMVDTIMLGHYGEFQISGSSLANDFINIFQIMCMGMGYGAAVLTAQCWGSRKLLELKKTVTLMLRICLLISTLFSLITWCFPRQLMSLYTNDANIIEKGILYFRISAFSYIPTGLTLTLTAILRSVREVKLPLVVSLMTFGVNIFFNWVLIFGHLGMPELQIAGAAMGTLIARLFEAGIIGVYFIMIDQKIGYRIKDLFVKCGKVTNSYIKYSIPVLISDTLLGLGNTIVAMIIGHLGASFVAANAIVSQVNRMSVVFTQGVSSSASVITGNTLGEGDVKKTYEQSITFLILSVLIGIMASLIILGIAPIVISGFHINQETRDICYELMVAVAIMVVFQSVQSVLTKGVLRGGGDTQFLMLADILFLWLVSVPFGYWVGLVLNASPFWIYVSLKLDFIIKSVWCTIRLVKGKWMKETIS